MDLGAGGGAGCIPPPPEVLVIGRLGVDLYPLQDGVGLADVTSFGKYLGGSAANVAVAAARHGHRVQLVSGVGDDPFGRYLLRELGRLGVDPIAVRVHPGVHTPVTFCELFPPDDFPLYFYREPVAPDLLVTPDDLPASALAQAELVWCTVTGLSREPSLASHHALLEQRADRRRTVLDLDFRPVLWDDPATATARVDEVLDRVGVVVGNREECRMATGEDDPDRAAAALLDRGVWLAVVKQGPAGVLAVTADERVEIPAHPVDVVNGLGAGDAFGGALVHGLLTGAPLEQLVRFAGVAGALVAGRRECSTAMPTTAEVLQALRTAAPAGGPP